MGSYSTPTFADLDGDGDRDAVVGNAKGNLSYFINVGNRTNPSFIEKTGSNNPFHGFVIGSMAVLDNGASYAAPAFVDCDKDGDFDLFVGNAGGNIQYFENTGTAGPFYVEKTGPNNPFDGADAGSFAAPAFIDIESDGDQDAVIGTLSGSVKLFRNWGVEQYCFYRGSFSTADGRCICSAGFSGFQCFEACPGVGTEAGVCNSQGACYTSGAKEGSCICNSGYGGMDNMNRLSCDNCKVVKSFNSKFGRYVNSAPSYYGNGTSGRNLNCKLCPGGGQCSGHGLCSAGSTGVGTCSCTLDYTGDDCSKRKACGAGMYVDSINDNCVACKAGRFHPDGSGTKCLLCGIGYYSAMYAANCTSCPVTSTTTIEGAQRVDQCKCAFGSYMSPAKRCEQCPIGAVCSGGPLLTPKAGFWTPSITSVNIWKCKADGLCLGGYNSTCKFGHVGPLCELCETGFGMSYGGCIKCTDRTGNAMTWIVLVIAAVAACSCMFCICLPETSSNSSSTNGEADGVEMGDLLGDVDNVASTSTHSDLDQKSRKDLQMVQKAVGIHIVPISVEETVEEAEGLFEETASIADFFSKFINVITKCMSSLKILIGFSQILSVMDLNFSVQWPSAFLSFSSVLAVANLDVFQSINVDCLTSTWTYYSKFHVIIIIPLVLFLLQLILWWIRSQMTTAPEEITTQHVKGWLFFLFLIYPTVSSGTLKVWHCVEVEGEEYLSADFRITCKGPEYELNVILAFVAFLIYVVGIPASLLAILWTHKDHLYEKEGEPEDPEQVQTQERFGFLYSAYEEETWWWEIALLIHKLCLTGLIIFIKPNTVSQLATGFVFSIFFLVLHVFRNAYVEDADDTLQFTAMLSLTMTLFFGIVIKTDDEEDDDYGRSVVAFLLVANNVMVVCLFLVQLVIKATSTTSTGLTRQKLMYKVMKRSLRLVRPKLTQNIYQLCKTLGIVEVHDYVKTAVLLMEHVDQKLQEFIAHAENVQRVFQLLEKMTSAGNGTKEEDPMKSVLETVDAWWRLVVEVLGEEEVTELVQPGASNALHHLEQLCQQHDVDMPDCVGQITISATMFGVVNGPSVCISTVNTFMEDMLHGLDSALLNLASSTCSMEIALKTAQQMLMTLEAEHSIMSMVLKDEVGEEWLTLTVETLHADTVDIVQEAVTNGFLTEEGFAFNLDPTRILYELHRLTQMADAFDMLVQMWRLYACILGPETLRQKYLELTDGSPDTGPPRLAELVNELCTDDVPTESKTAAKPPAQFVLSGFATATYNGLFYSRAPYDDYPSFQQQESPHIWIWYDVQGSNWCLSHAKDKGSKRSKAMLDDEDKVAWMDASWSEIVAGEWEEASVTGRAVEIESMSAALMKQAKKIFDRYDFDGSGTCNSLEEAQQMTMNMVFSLSYQGPWVGDAYEKIAAGPLRFAEENPMNFEQFMEYFIRTFGPRPDGPGPPEI